MAIGATTPAEALAGRIKAARSDVFRARVLLDQAKDSERVMRREAESAIRSGDQYLACKNEGERKAWVAEALQDELDYQDAVEVVRRREQERDEAVLRLEMAEDDWRAYAYAQIEAFNSTGRLTDALASQAIDRMAERIVHALNQRAR